MRLGKTARGREYVLYVFVYLLALEKIRGGVMGRLLWKSSAVVTGMSLS